jgi:hypothetical protein
MTTHGAQSVHDAALEERLDLIVEQARAGGDDDVTVLGLSVRGERG